tara:strand:+ start:3229 stop:4266 length:1038 start_codon:yes stop_codon:yes gene_type:complete
MIKEEQILTSYNFARNANVVFGEILTHEEFNSLDVEKYEIINKTDTTIFYKLMELHLKENDIIFCNTDLIFNLFKNLKNINTLKNIKLITNQTDTLISERIYRLKPDCISEWYSVNVGYERLDLIPIPLGISNNYTPKNLIAKDFSTNSKYEESILEKKNLLYVNFVSNTNYKEREGLYELFKTKAWADVQEPSLILDDYKNDLRLYNFTLAPWGNGIDTHRIWEAIYSGSIPITKNHTTFSNFSDLPILFVDSYEEINKELLESFLDSYDLKNFNLAKLEIDFWITQMNKQKINSNFKVALSEGTFSRWLFIKKHSISSKNKSYLKKIKYFFKQIKKAFKKYVW